MLNEIDEDIALYPITNGHTRESSCSDSSVQHMSKTTLPFKQSMSSVGDAGENDGIDCFDSPTPARGFHGALLNRHSIECVAGESGRPCVDSDSSRPSVDSAPPSPLIMRSSYQRFLDAKRKESSTASMHSYSSVNSSPCPRPARKKLLMLTGNKLPKAPLKQPTLSNLSSIPSVESGRVMRLKDSLESKLSPGRDETMHCKWKKIMV